VTLFTMTLFADILALFGAAYAGELLIGVSPLSFYHGVTSGLLGMATWATGSSSHVLRVRHRALELPLRAVDDGRRAGVGRASTRRSWRARRACSSSITSSAFCWVERRRG